jgi:hypothetical protein
MEIDESNLHEKNNLRFWQTAICINDWLWKLFLYIIFGKQPILVIILHKLLWRYESCGMIFTLALSIWN